MPRPRARPVRAPGGRGPEAAVAQELGCTRGWCLALVRPVRSRGLVSEMSREGTITLYDGPPVWAKMTGWLFVVIGGIVMLPLALANHAWWLLVPAVPVLLAGMVLLQTRLRIAFEHRAAQLVVTNYLFGLRLRQRKHPRSEVMGLDLRRVAGDERERASDTWYLKLRLHTHTYTIGRYGSRLDALQARRAAKQALQVQPQTAAEIWATAEEALQAEPERASAHYQMGLALLRSGDAAGAHREFEKALTLARQPLLRRMVKQRLEELSRR